MVKIIILKLKFLVTILYPMSKLFFYFFFIVCFLGNAQLAFQENALNLGVAQSYGSSNLGGGVSFVDFDNDGWDDITFATGDNMETLFFKNLGGTFVQVELGINDTYETKQVIWVDYDNDGDKDFFATSITGLNKFYRNEGNLTFTDITETTGLFTENLYTYGAAFGDIDNDGDLDIFLTNRDVISLDQRNYLYLNDNGFYVDVTETAGLFMGNELSFCASFFDYNKDGLQDIYVSNDKYTKINRLYKNNGDNTFDDVSEASGAGMAIDAMSTTIDDYNGDGWLDIYVTNTTEGNYHLRNNGDGTFTNVAEALGTAFYSIAWGAVFLDAENDGDLDLYVSGMLDGSNSSLPSAFYQNLNGFYTIPSNIGFDEDTRTSFSNAIGDFNNDGLPDIIVMNDTEPNFLWENKSNTNHNWVKLKLEGTTSNRDGIGSTIEIVANGKSHFRYTLCGEGYLGQHSNIELIGLLNAPVIDYIKVIWLSGIEDIIQNVDVNKTYKVIEGTGEVEEIFTGETPFEDEDNDGVSDAYDLCPATPDNTVVDSDGCTAFSLPSTNFRILTTSESCASSNNGSIQIEVVETLNYTAVLTGVGVNREITFNETALFQDLSSGSYTVCITVEGQVDYEICFDVIISEPEDLSVSSVVSTLDNELSLTFKGAREFIIHLNQKEYRTSQSEMKLPLVPGTNKLLVKTIADCQGTYEQTIFINSGIIIYPNPSPDGIFTLNEGFTSETIIAQVFDLQGRSLGTYYISESGKVDLSTLESGMYLINFIGPGFVYIEKLIKL